MYLTSESISFFKEVSIIEFLTNKEWTPLFVKKNFGILPLVTGTLLTTFIVSVALPVGITIAIYLRSINKRFKKITKPLLEILKQLLHQL